MSSVISSASLHFKPFVAPDFRPLVTELSRAGRPYPVVIEKFSESFHKDTLPQQAALGIQRAISRTPTEHHSPFNLLMRSLQGSLLAYSCNYLVSHGRPVQMDCQTTTKLDQDSDDAVQNVGLAFLLARILYMQAEHPANSRYQKQLFGFVPEVLNHYRRVCGMEPLIDLTGLALDDLSASEGERLLKEAPIELLPIKEPID